MCVFRACNLCADKHVQRFFIWVSYHDEHARALAARASTQICHGACGSCPCRSRPLRLCVPADPVPAPITWRLLLIITFKRILPMQLLHMRLRHPQQLLVHAPIATYYQYPRAIPVSAAPELQLYILLHFRRRGERGDAARKCLQCEVTYHELCAHAANTAGVIKEYKDGCPTCHMHVL